MLASVAAVFTNVVLNYVLIFGKLGFSPMGVEGAAWATVAARVVEMVIVVLWAHLHRGKFSYLKGAYRSFYIPARLCAQIASKGMPLMLNELFWALGMTVRNQCYSTRGIDVVAGLNIASTVVNLFSVVYMAVGHSMAVLIGNTLGAGKLEEARDGANKMLAFSVLSAASMGFLMLCGAGAFPYMYNTSSGVRDIASYMLVVSAFTMPFVAFAYSVYFVLRAGGRVVMTVMLDSGYVWAIVIPVSVILSYFTAVDIRILYPLAQASEAIKFIFAIYLLKKGTWVRRLVADKN
jgi:Na+-driven multidrug efflux pump